MLKDEIEKKKLNLKFKKAKKIKKILFQITVLRNNDFPS
jgi:hypothetical protein